LRIPLQYPAQTAWGVWVGVQPQKLAAPPPPQVFGVVHCASLTHCTQLPVGLLQAAAPPLPLRAAHSASAPQARQESETSQIGALGLAQFALERHCTQVEFPVLQYGAEMPQLAFERHSTHWLVPVLQTVVGAAQAEEFVPVHFTHDPPDTPERHAGAVAPFRLLHSESPVVSGLCVQPRQAFPAQIGEVEVVQFALVRHCTQVFAGPQ
jgi:hypothetical protein